MDEETQETEEEESEDATEDKDVRLSPKEERAKHIKELRESNAELKELLAEERELQSQREVGGGSEAGAVPPKPKGETAEELADKFTKGEVDLLGDNVK